MTSDVASEKLFDNLRKTPVASILNDLVEPGISPLGISKTPSNISFDEPDNSSIAYFGVKDQSLTGPNNVPYTSTFVLDPLITVERHHGKYHITARFNIETTIIGYNLHKREGHELFFQDICLQYISSSNDEDLIAEPQSDPSSAFTVTRSSSTTVSGNVGVSQSGVPSANISLGISRSRECTIERTVNTWSVSAHRIISDNGKRRQKLNIPRYQWFWATNYRDISALTPDLTQTVKRHVMIKRIIPIHTFPVNRLESAREVLRIMEWKEKIEHSDAPEDLKSAQYSLTKRQNKAWEELLADRRNDRRMPLESLLEFKFSIQVRLRKRYGRLHRTLSLSSNRNKAKLLEPTYREKFRLRPALTQDLKPHNNHLSEERAQRPYNFPSERYLQHIVRIPLADTCDLRDVIAKVKSKYDGRWDELQSKEWVDLLREETGLEVQEADTVDSMAEETAQETKQETEQEIEVEMQQDMEQDMEEAREIMIEYGTY